MKIRSWFLVQRKRNKGPVWDSLVGMKETRKYNGGDRSQENAVKY